MTMPLLAILGRPNVGKSTLVNRIIARSEAIVHGQPGVTRDRNYFKAEWRGREFSVVDTGGLEGGNIPELSHRISEQAVQALRESDLALLVLDLKEGLTAGDLEIAEQARRMGKLLLPVVNKVDNLAREMELADFWQLGLGEPIPVSATHGLGVGDLLDRVVELFPEQEEPEDEGSARTVAIVGRPNVGKSSLFNRLIRQERAIVSDMPGTTRDAIDTRVEIDGCIYEFIDTAGWRRRNRVTESVEYYSQVRVWRAIDRAQVAILVIDASEGVTDQDQKIASRIREDGKAAVVVLNKWDLVPGQAARDFLADAREELHFVGYAPFITTSALKGSGLGRLIPSVEHAFASRMRRVPTPQLNTAIAKAVNANPPPAKRGKSMRLFYVTQARVAPPEFVFFVSDARMVTPSYRRFLERKIRETYDFAGTPIRIAIRSKRETGGSRT